MLQTMQQSQNYLNPALQQTSADLDRAKLRLQQVPLLQEKIKELQTQLAYNQQAYGHDLAEKQADCDFKEEQVRGLTAKVDKVETNALSLQTKIADTESASNHMRRIMQSMTDEKVALE